MRKDEACACWPEEIEHENWPQTNSVQRETCISFNQRLQIVPKENIFSRRLTKLDHCDAKRTSDEVRHKTEGG